MHPLRRALPYAFAFWVVAGLAWAAWEWCAALRGAAQEVSEEVASTADSVRPDSMVF